MGHVPVKIDATKGLPALPDITDAQIELYLGFLETSGRKRYSAIMAGVAPGRMAYLMSKNSDLQAMELSAMQGYCELVKAAIHDRAINGVPRSVYFKGRVVGTEMHYSDTLLLALAKAHMPEFRDSVSVDANVKAGVLVVHTSLDPEDWEKQYGDMRIDQSRIDGVCAEQDQAPSQDDG